ncbi:ABC transporter permease [Singulisphaera sp. PoT]|uniref:HoxN/HupN/NixA family nickel/cobalt transporter n=1 Tax=Singulisphaera sp. PoT TaxID=3411797 RepID=UPI003BF4CBBE
MRRHLVLLACLHSLALAGQAHDIPNARIDRSIQLSVEPGLLHVSYEVSLSDLTLLRDLRDLIGPLPDENRLQLLERYGNVTGPLNAKGLLASVDGQEIELKVAGFKTTVEEHPRLDFHFEAKLPGKGRVAFRDTNFAGSQGTSRLAVKGLQGVSIRADDLPYDVNQIEVRPVWQLSDAEEQRTKEVEFDFLTEPKAPVVVAAVAPAPKSVPTKVEAKGPRRLVELLDSAPRSSFSFLMLLACGLGALHALQPGHGKTLVASAAIDRQGRWLPSAFLALMTTLTHVSSVLVIAGGLWLTRASNYGQIHVVIARVAGFTIAAIGLWRLGRHLAGQGEHSHRIAPTGGKVGFSGLVGLGIAGGLVPCWDAVALIVLAGAVGRLGLGVLLLIAFSVGMAGVLVAVGWLAVRLRQTVLRSDASGPWDRRLGIAGSLILSVIGIALLISA